jgi:hypothetical protein
VTVPAPSALSIRRLRCGIVLRAEEDACQILAGGHLSAGLPGAEWWVAGKAVDRAEYADVELDEVVRLYTEHDMWDSAFG